jgi:MraZ protein
VLRGNYAARIDDKARLKIPNAFRALVEKTHGAELFVTSLTGESVRIYPMPVWLALEERLANAPSTLPARNRFLDRVNYFGQAAEIDGQGRVVIHQRLRESAGMSGDVDVLGAVDRLDVWNHDRLVAKMLSDPYTDEDAKSLSEFGI